MTLVEEKYEVDDDDDEQEEEGYSDERIYIGLNSRNALKRNRWN